MKLLWPLNQIVLHTFAVLVLIHEQIAHLIHVGAIASNRQTKALVCVVIVNTLNIPRKSIKQ